MGRIAIAAAMQEELGALLATMTDEQPVVLARRQFWIGHLDGHDVVAVLSRIGKVAAAMTATLLVHEFGAERAIFTGTAGGLGPAARVGDVVVASALLQHDMDASPLFPRHEVPLYGTDRFHADETLSAALAEAARAMFANADSGTDDADLAIDAAQLRAFGIATPRVHAGIVVSGDRFVASASEAAALRQRLPDALAVEMKARRWHRSATISAFPLPWCAPSRTVPTTRRMSTSAASSRRSRAATTLASCAASCAAAARARHPDRQAQRFLDRWLGASVRSRCRKSLACPPRRSARRSAAGCPTFGFPRERTSGFGAS